MRAFDRLLVTVREWLRPGRLDEDFAEELKFHLDHEIQANLSAGMSPSEARRAAQLSLGGTEAIREESREWRAGAGARQFARDFRYGCRLLRRSPGFAASTTTIVALGIASVTAIFSVVDGVMLKPLPYHEPDRLVSLWSTLPRLGLPRANVNAADVRDWRTSSRSFVDVALVRNIANFNLIGSGEPERLQAARVSANLFSVLGVTPALGRTFVEHEDEEGRDRVALLSDGLWRRQFGADPAIIGQRINLSGVPHEVVGVMRPDFHYPGREFQVWTPLTIDPAVLARQVPGYDWLAVARLAPNVTVAQAQAEMEAIAKRLADEYPMNRQFDAGVLVVPMLDDLVRDVRSALYLLLAAVCSLLLIACLNLSNLLGARAVVRSKEFALRLALGAGRSRVAIQALAEVTPILLIGGAAGILVALWAVKAFVAVAPAALPRVENIAIDGSVLAFSLASLALTGLVAGLFPVVQASRLDLTGATREDGRSTIGSRRQTRLRSALVVLQISLVLPLLVGAGLLIRSFSALTQINPGFRPDNILTLHLAIPRSKYGSDEEVAAFTGRLQDRVRSLPGVASAGLVNRLPLGGVGQTGPLEFDNARALSQSLPNFDWRTATPDYFRAMGIPLLEGRSFTERDAASAPVVGVVDDWVARALWPGQSALGKRFRIPVPGQPWTEVVGVVGHVRHDGLDVDTRPQVYWNYRQRAQDRMVLVVRGSRDVQALTSAVVGAIHDVDPEQPLYDVRTMVEVVDRSVGGRWLNLVLLTAFAVVALTLASAGVYGVVAYGVSQQIREFGIRLALGATRRDISRLVLGRGSLLGILGTLVGVLLAVVLARAMESLLFGVKPYDATSFALATSVLVGVALLASYLPARRAASVDPAITLR